MTIAKAISQADALRDNVIDASQKAEWVIALDMEIAEVMDETPEPLAYPGDADEELLMPAPFDDVYVKHLIAQIDYYNMESGLYANDMVIYNQRISEAKAWLRRHEHRPKFRYWRTF